MNTHLITDAVRNSRASEEAGIWDRLFAFWFRRLVYTQIWEDPEADLAALQLAPGATIVTISSGGCNALSYLAAKPAQIFAVDLNEAHLSLLKLKLAGLRALPNYAQFWQFFGEGSSPANAKLYDFRLRPVLDAEARGYWDERDIRGRPRSITSPTAFIATVRSAASSALRISSPKSSASTSRCCCRTMPVRRPGRPRCRGCMACFIPGWRV